MSIAAAFLIDMTLKASLFCLLCVPVAALARRRSAAVRHDLWLTALASCALMPIAAAAFRLFGPTAAVAPVHDAVIALTPSLPVGTPPGAIEAIDRIWSGDGAAPQLDWAAGILVAAWLAGAAIAALRSLLAYRAAARIVRRAAPFPAASASAGIPVLLSGELEAPALFGLTKPVILLPRRAVRWPADRLRAVFAHELAHVARRDCLIELIVRITCAVHWPNPLVQLAARRLRTEREFACDEHVLRAGADASRYAAALVQVARQAIRMPQSALLEMARAPELERRVRTLLAAPPPRAGHGRIRAACAGLAVLAILLLAALTAPASGVLASGTVQPGSGDYGGLDDPLSERVPLAYDRLAVAAAAIPAVGPQAAPIAALKDLLDRQPQDYGDLVRERAIWTLSQVDDGRLFEPLAAHLGDPDWRVRAYAAWGLAMAGDRRATPLLAALLDDPVWRVRAMAAAALAEMADPRAATAMMAALGDPAWQVRIEVIDYVERRASPALARRLRPLLHDPHAGTRLRAQDALARL